MRLVIVSGMSGAGKSQVTHCLEDIGFYCIDNIPPVAIPKIAEICKQSEIEKPALVTDLRGKQMFSEIYDAFSELEKMNIEYEILFLEASDEVLVKRFSETRRKHPLVSEKSTVLSAIEEERKMMSKLKTLAHNVIDTSKLSVNQLNEQVKKLFAEGEKFEGLVTHIISFGFKNGIPIDADLVFDVRFLPNPFYITELKSHSGLDADVYDYVFSFEQTKEFSEKLADMIKFLHPHYIKEGKSQLVIAIGCTGGKHRSVSIARRLYDDLTASGIKNIFIGHRDLTF